MKLLVTGASGGVATLLRPLLAERYPVIRLTDRQPIGALNGAEEFVAADLTDPAALDQALDGMDAVLHLGGQAVEAPWETILAANIDGTYQLFERARLAGVQRVVFASSNHAVGFYPRGHTIGVNVTPLPDSRYGVSKVFGEALGALYANKHGMRVTSLRIGNVGELPLDRRRLSIWIHPEDLAQLVHIGLTHPDIHNEVFYGMSDNKRGWWDNAAAQRFGYQPAHQSEAFASEVLARSEAPDRVADYFQGGSFCADEFDGPPPR